MQEYFLTPIDQLPPFLVESFRKIQESIDLHFKKSEKLAHFSYEKGCLVLHFAEQKMSVDLIELWKYHKKQKYAVSSEPLYKALDLKKNKKIIDATCGTMKDSLLMLFWGAEVLAFERHPFIYMLLVDAIERAKQSEFIDLHSAMTHKFKLKFGNFIDFEYEYATEEHVIYFDPMYEQNEKRSALPRKEMVIFHQLIGPDSDKEQFFLSAIAKCFKRVIVKRSANSKKLSDTHLVHSYIGKSTAYDFYKSTLKPV